MKENSMLKGLYDVLFSDSPNTGVRIQLPKETVYIPSTTEDHGHLIIKSSAPDSVYTLAMALMRDAGVIETGYLYFSKLRGFTAVRKPDQEKQNKIKKIG